MRFGLIWVNPKESKTQRNQKNKETKKKQNKTKTCFPDQSEHAQIQVVPKTLCFLFFVFLLCLALFWVVNHSKLYFHQKRLVYGQQKANMVLDNVMYLGKQIAFCAPTTSLSVFLIEKACAWTTKNIRSCNISTTNNECIQTICDFSAGNKPFWKKWQKAEIGWTIA